MLSQIEKIEKGYLNNTIPKYALPELLKEKNSERLITKEQWENFIIKHQISTLRDRVFCLIANKELYEIGKVINTKNLAEEAEQEYLSMLINEEDLSIILIFGSQKYLITYDEVNLILKRNNISNFRARMQSGCGPIITTEEGLNFIKEQLKNGKLTAERANFLLNFKW